LHRQKRQSLSSGNGEERPHWLSLNITTAQEERFKSAPSILPLGKEGDGRGRGRLDQAVKDEGSTDDTAGRCGKMKGKKGFGGAGVVRNPPEKGNISARNGGVKFAPSV